MPFIDKIEVDLEVFVGHADLSIQELLQKGRGAVISLERDDKASLEITANGRKFAKGKVVLRGEQVCVEVL